MDQNINNKIELRDKLISFFKTNKLKIYVLIGILLITAITVSFIKINNEKKLSLIAEQYVEAGLYLSSNKKEKAIELYEKIIVSKNKFYSILALNTVLEKNLIRDKSKILNYFQLVEKLNISKEQYDLIIFKKALYLIKIENREEGNKLLNVLKNKNSKLTPLIEELIIK